MSQSDKAKVLFDWVAEIQSDRHLIMKVIQGMVKWLIKGSMSGVHNI